MTKGTQLLSIEQKENTATTVVSYFENVQMMKDSPRGSQVDESKVNWEEPTGEFDRFGVRRSI
jgi:hypothetical protein